MYPFHYNPYHYPASYTSRGPFFIPRPVIDDFAEFRPNEKFFQGDGNYERTEKALYILRFLAFAQIFTGGVLLVTDVSKIVLLWNFLTMSDVKLQYVAQLLYPVFVIVLGFVCLTAVVSPSSTLTKFVLVLVVTTVIPTVLLPANSPFVSAAMEAMSLARTVESAFFSIQPRDLSRGMIQSEAANKMIKMLASHNERWPLGIKEGLKYAQTNPNVTIAVLTGTGNYYCSGNDLSNFAAAATKDAAGVKAMAEEAKVVLRDYVKAYIDYDKPLVALINGPAIGISVTVLALFDAVYATNKATFQTPFAQVGQSPEGASAYTFPLLMGPTRAAEFLLFGRKLSALEAKEFGLVNEVFEEGTFAQQTSSLLANYSSLPPESMRESKKLLRKIHKDNLYKEECDLICDRWQSAECKNAIVSFLSKSKK
ncbi:unnamed protein product, partial [Mesorhabditis spiculigera]